MRDVNRKKVDPVKERAIARAKYLKVCASLTNVSSMLDSVFNI